MVLRGFHFHETEIQIFKANFVYSIMFGNAICDFFQGIIESYATWLNSSYEILIMN